MRRWPAPPPDQSPAAKGAAVRDGDYLAGLRAERENAARAGRKDRVKQVEAEIARVSGVCVERAVDKRPVEKRG